MHEMAIVTKIVEAVCSKARELESNRVISITLRVGELRDFQPDLVQRYFDWFSKGTAAEGARVDLMVVPVRFRCPVCGSVFGFDMRRGGVILFYEGGIESSSLAMSEEAPGEAALPDGVPACPLHPDEPVDMISGNELSIWKMVIE